MKITPLLTTAVATLITLSATTGDADAAAYVKFDEIKGEATNSDHEANQKALALEILDSYDVSFDVEDTLAERVTDYPIIMMQALSGGEWMTEAQAWDMDAQKLLNDRMLLRQYRHNLAVRLQTTS